MSREFLLKTAEALEKLAEHLDQEEVQRQELAQAERLKIARALGEKVAHVTGETLPEDILVKIAASDQGVIEAFTKLAAQHAETSPDGLGEASDIHDNNSTTLTSKQASASVGDHFLNWIMS